MTRVHECECLEYVARCAHFDGKVVTFTTPETRVAYYVEHNFDWRTPCSGCGNYWFSDHPVIGVIGPNGPRGAPCQTCGVPPYNDEAKQTLTAHISEADALADFDARCEQMLETI